MDIVERLKAIVKYSNLSVRMLAKQLGMNQQTLDKYVKGMSEPRVSVLSAILSHFPEVSAEWLLSGEGAMLKSENEMARLNSMLDTITTLQETINIKNDTIAILTNRIKELEQLIQK